MYIQKLHVFCWFKEENMRYLADGSQMKGADQYTIQEVGIPSLELMERAAQACVRVMEKEGLDLSKPCVVCGSGNNGGDGFAIARLLLQKDHVPAVWFVGNDGHCTGETSWQRKRFLEIGGEICNEYREDEYSIIIDAVFGVGLNRKAEGRYGAVLEQMNRAPGVKFAVDLPSGVSADTGKVPGAAFRADVTVTFQLEKLGLVLYPGREYAGRIYVEDIGIHTERLAKDPKRIYVCDQADYREMLPVRRADSHKGTYGKLLVIAGSKGMSGAAFLNGKAAYLSGAGLVRIYTPEENRVILQQLLPEAIITTYTDFREEELDGLLSWADAVCIGSGIGTGETAGKILKTTLERAAVPCLVDADGLNLLAEFAVDRNLPGSQAGLSGRDFKVEESRQEPKPDTRQLVLTPHMKEMSRLLHGSVEELKADRLNLLKDYADSRNVTCVLKDSRTMVASRDEGICVNRSGNASMAKAGSGDVLAGIIAGLLAQGLKSHTAAVLGAYLHGRAGDYAQAAKGSYSVMAQDLLLYLSEAFKETDKKPEAGDEELQQSLCED